MGAMLAVFVFGTVGALFYLQVQISKRAAEGDAGEVAVAVVAPGGRLLFNGTVIVSNATALSALERAAEVGRFEVVTRDYPHGRYVESIGGYAAEGTRGWIYEVARADGTVPGDRAADAFPLRAGDVLVWRWVDAANA